MTPSRLSELKELAEKATAGPWFYRPDRYDDWGWVRAAKAAPDETGWTVACCKAGEWLTPAQEDEHRRNKTDPYGHNARFIAAARTAVPELVAEVERLREALEPERLAKLIYETWLKAADGPEWVSLDMLSSVAPNDYIAVYEIVEAIRARAALGGQP